MKEREALEAIRAVWESLPKYTRDWDASTMENAIMQMSHYADLALQLSPDTLAKRLDRQWIAGAKFGWNAGVAGAEEAYLQAINGRINEIAALRDKHA